MHVESKGFQEGERIAKLSVFTLLAVGIIELAFSQISGSISLLADGIGSIADAGVSLFVWAGLHFARKKPSSKFPFGYYKVESLTALIAALALVGTAAFILVRSYRGFLNPEPLTLPSLAMLILLAAGFIALYRALLMRQIANRYNILSLKVDASNAIKDAASSFVAFGSVLGASLGFLQADAIGGMIIAGFIATISYVAIKESSLILLDAFHDPELTREIESIIKSHDHVKEIRELRLRRAGPFIVGILEIVVDGDMTVSQAHTVATDLENSVKSRIVGLRSLTVRAIPSG